MYDSEHVDFPDLDELDEEYDDDIENKRQYMGHHEGFVAKVPCINQEKCGGWIYKE